MSSLPIARKNIFKKARKSFWVYKHADPHTAAVINREQFQIGDDKYLNYIYEDEKFNNWIAEYREILNDKKKYKKALKRYRREHTPPREVEGEEEWRVNLKEFEQLFLPRSAPEILIKLARHQNKKKDFLTHFYLSSEGNGNDRPFIRDRKLAEQFVIFGGSDGNYFAYWKTDKKLKKCPIVCIHHEVHGSQVLANNIEQFLQLVTDNDRWVLGLEEDTVVSMKRDMSNDSYYRESTREHLIEAAVHADKQCKKLGRWLLKSFDIQPASNPQSIVDAAVTKHGDFEEWLLDRWVDESWNFHQH